jgi:hypothetical protein
MRKAEKHVTQEDMWATLARHANVEVQVQLSKEREAPKEQLRVREPLKWHEPVKTGGVSGYVLSQCGRFSISKDSVKGKPMYMAWLRKDPPHDSVSLGIRLTLKEAEHLCELATQR